MRKKAVKKTAKKKAAPRRKRSRKRRSRRKGIAWGRWLLTLGLLSALALGIYAVYLDKIVRDRFTAQRWDLPARVYARPLELYAGQALRPPVLLRELKALGYRPVERPVSPGTYARQGQTYEIHARAFHFWDEAQPAARLRIRFDGAGIAALHVNGSDDVALWRLEPQEIASILPLHGEDRELVALDQVPISLINALLATEDRQFYQHHGVNLKAIARAAWANLKVRRVVQGGSTITQQLIKNFYLNAERSLLRKANEALMALLLEWRFDKDDILEAYLNEVYLGQQGRRAIHGFGLASRFYFGRPLQNLTVAETALLVTQVRGASYYNPWRHPKRARARRDRIIDQMQAEGSIEQPAASVARAAPLGIVAKPVAAAGGQYADYIDLVRLQLRRDYQEDDLRRAGLRIFTGMDTGLQHAAQQALETQLAAVEQRRKLPANSLQGAVVLVQAATGEVAAMVGGRGVRDGAFNRALTARRQVGSLLKPVVYLAALRSSDQYTLTTPIDDGPISVPLPKGAAWEPRNADRRWHGMVPLEQALAQSYNAATVRIGTEVGVAQIARLTERLTGAKNLPAHPALLLGAQEFTPVQMAQLYQTLANGGFRAPLRSITEVVDRDGQPLQRFPLTVDRAVHPGATYLLNNALQEVVQSGTAKILNRQYPGYQLAGKTGTTDARRDAWFGGLAGDYAGVVWVGRDDNKPTTLTGASGALPVWSRLIAALPDAHLRLNAPASVQWQWVDVQANLRAGPECEGADQRPYLIGSAPQGVHVCVEELDSLNDSGPGLLEGLRGWFDKLGGAN